MTSQEYVQKLSFRYIKTYSFHRGEKLEQFLDDVTKEIKSLKEELKTARFMQKWKISNRISELENKKQLYGTRLTDENYNISETAIEIKTLQFADPETKKILEILETELKDQVFAMCSPMYRDAVVFFDKHDKIISVANVCLECYYMQTDKGQWIDAGRAVYPELKKNFKELGHPVEQDET